jgi:hypothetical protein
MEADGGACGIRLSASPPAGLRRQPIQGRRMHTRRGRRRGGANRHSRSRPAGGDAPDPPGAHCVTSAPAHALMLPRSRCALPVHVRSRPHPQWQELLNPAQSESRPSVGLSYPAAWLSSGVSAPTTAAGPLAKPSRLCQWSKNTRVAPWRLNAGHGRHGDSWSSSVRSDGGAHSHPSITHAGVSLSTARGSEPARGPATPQRSRCRAPCKVATAEAGPGADVAAGGEPTRSGAVRHGTRMEGRGGPDSV